MTTHSPGRLDAMLGAANKTTPVANGCSLQPGSRVKARYMATSKGPAKCKNWFLGTIRRVNEDDTCDIEYDDVAASCRSNQMTRPPWKLHRAHC